MANQDVRSFLPDFKYYYRNGSTTSVASARDHRIRKAVGYTGPKPNLKPMPAHPYSFVVNEAEAYVDEARVWSANDISREYGWALSRIPTQLVFDPPQDYEALYADALAKFNGKVRGDLDLSIDLAESHQVLRMLDLTDKLDVLTRKYATKYFYPKSSKGLIDVARAVVNSKNAKALGGYWLEYVYGVKPLVSSIYGVADELIRVNINKLERYKARATRYDWRPSRVFLNTVYGAIYRDLGKTYSKLSVSLGAVLKTQDEDLSRFTSLNPVSIAWELLPYSFVADWVYNIGGYLRAVETSILYSNRFDSGYRTNFMVIESEIDQKFTYTSYPTGYNKWSGKVKALAYERSILTQYPGQDRPIFEVDLGSSRLLSAASLLAQHLGRRPPGPRVI